MRLLFIFFLSISLALAAPTAPKKVQRQANNINSSNTISEGKSKDFVPFVVPKDSILPGERENIDNMEEVVNPFTADIGEDTIKIDQPLVESILTHVGGVIVNEDSRSLLAYGDDFLREGDFLPLDGEPMPDKKMGAKETRLKILHISKTELIIGQGGSEIRIPLSLTRGEDIAHRVDRPLYSIMKMVGNGVYISTEGHLITSYDAIKGAGSLELSDGQFRGGGTVMFTLSENGGTDLNLALIAVETTSSKVLPFDTDYKFTPNETLYTISSFDLNSKITVSKGVYALSIYGSNNEDKIHKLKDSLPIEFTGAPVFTPSGKVVGILTTIVGNTKVDRFITLSALKNLIQQQVPSLSRALSNVEATDLPIKQYINSIIDVSSVTKFMSPKKELPIKK